MRPYFWVIPFFVCPVAGTAQLPGGVSGNLKLWLKADAGVFSNAGVTAANNNSLIQQWNDYSTLSNNASQTTSADRPTFKSNTTDNINFNPVVRFAFSNSEWLTYPIGTAPISSNPFEVFVVSRVGTLTGSRAMYGAGTAGTNNGVGCYFDSGLLRFNLTGNTFSANAPQVATGAILQTTFGYSTANGRQIDLNGTPLGTETTKIANIASAVGKVGLDWTSSNHFDGDIAEIILFAADNTATDKNKIETYLFLKYGITGTHDYMSSNGTIIWDIGGSGGFDNDIAGIGRDAALHQKQATSINSDDLITIANGSVAADNNANSNALTNGNYLIWGNNNGNQLFTNRMSGTSLDIMERTWRVKETGTIGNVLLRIPASVISGTSPKIVRSSDAAFTSTDGLVAMSLNGSYYEGTIDFTDGEYFTIAQTPVAAPGGVSQYLKFWVKADKGLYSDAGVTQAATSGSIQQWNDQSGYNQHAAQATSANRPTYQNRLINYNPTVYFDQTFEQHLTFPATAATTGSESFEVFAVTRPTNVSISRPYFGFGASSTNDGAGFNMETGKLRFNFSGNPFTVSNVSINASYVYQTAMGYNTTNGRQMYLNGVLQGSDNSIVPTIQSTVGKIGLDYSSSGTWEGDIAELIFYATDHSTTNKYKVATYLALKYGTQLTHDYISSNGTMLWDIGNTGGYDYTIAGMGRDAAFYQKQSKPENGTEFLAIGAGGTIAANNSLNPTVLTEGSYLLWGSNNGAAAIYTALGSAQKMNRQWRIREVGETGILKLQYSSLILDFGGSGSAYLCVSSDATFDLNDTFVEMTLNNGAYEANYNFTDGQYFTFAKGFICLTPSFTMTSLQATCSNGVASNNASLALQTKDNSTLKLGYSIGGTYTGVNYASATNVGALPFTLVNTLSNPLYAQPYTIRGFCDANRYQDKVVILNPKICISANLNLSVTPSSVTKNKGEWATLIYTLTNSGADTAPDVTAKIPIPANVTLMNAVPQQGTYNMGTKLWNVGTLAVGSKTLTVTVKMN